MSSQSSTSSLESLNESSTTKYGLEPYMHEPTISNKKNICYDTEARYVQMIIVMEIQTGVYICGNFSKMETSTESLCCCEMLEISDE